MKELKRQSTDWEKIFSIHPLDKGLVSKKYRELLQHKETNNLILKTGKSSEQPFHKRRYECTVEMRYHYMSTRAAKILNSENTKGWRWQGGTGTPMGGWECKIDQPFWKTVWELLVKLNINLPFVSSVLLLGIYPREMKHDLIKSSTVEYNLVVKRKGHLWKKRALYMLPRTWACNVGKTILERSKSIRSCLAGVGVNVWLR